MELALWFLLLIIICLGKKKGHLWMIPQATFIKCLNTWRKLIDPTSGQGCHFVFCAFSIYLYISTLPLISHTSTLTDLLRESSLLSKSPHFRQLAGLITFAASISLRPSFFKELFTRKFSLLLLYPLFSFFFS